MGFLVRMKKLNEFPRTPTERKLAEQRAILSEWQSRGLGFKYPATAERRLLLGENIKRLKGMLLDSGLYKDAASMESRKDGAFVA